MKYVCALYLRTSALKDSGVENNFLYLRDFFVSFFMFMERRRGDNESKRQATLLIRPLY